MVLRTEGKGMDEVRNGGAGAYEEQKSKEPVHVSYMQEWLDGCIREYIMASEGT